MSRRCAVRIPPKFGQPLNSRELECLNGLSRGLTVLGIAKELWLAPDTIKAHLCRMYVKLGVHNQHHAVAVGYRTRLLKIDCGDQASLC